MATIAQILKEPFGSPAYWDEDILSDECKSVKAKLLKLENVILTCDGKITGLTYCEPGQPECREEYVRKRGVLFRGVLTIEKAKWLNETGKEVLLREFRKRDEKIRRSSFESQLTLRDAFSVKTKPKIWIQARKTLPALFLYADLLPYGLGLYGGQKRFYHVLSMDAETLQRSQLYLARYRLRRQIDNLIKPLIVGAIKKNNPRPRDICTVPWFISQYMKEIYKGPSGRSAAKVQRKLEDLVIAHGDWIIKDDSKTTKAKINRDEWRLWLKRHRNTRRPQADDSNQEDASEDGGIEVDDRQALGGSEDDRMEIDETPSRGTGSRIIPSKRTLSPYDSSRSAVEEDNEPEQRTRDIDDASSLEYYDPNENAVLPPASAEPFYYRQSDDELDELDYPDSEFTDDSPPPSDTESEDSFVVPEIETEPAVLAAIPAVLGEPPRIPRSGNSWYCPVRGCDHEIDMYDLREDHPHVREVLSQEEFQYIAGDRWSWYDEPLLRCFRRLVSRHYEDHFDWLGVEVVGEGKTLHFRWKHEAEHPTQHVKVIMERLRRPAADPIKIESQS